MNPYQDAIDALSGTINPENADAALAFVEGLPALIEALSGRLGRDGEVYVHEFPTHPSAGEGAKRLGGLFGTAHSGVVRFRDVFYKVHEKELNRLLRPRHNERAWDVQENPQTVGRG